MLIGMLALLQIQVHHRYPLRRHCEFGCSFIGIGLRLGRSHGISRINVLGRWGGFGLALRSHGNLPIDVPSRWGGFGGLVGSWQPTLDVGQRLVTAKF